MYSDGRDSKSSPFACICCRTVCVLCCFFTLLLHEEKITESPTHTHTHTVRRSAVIAIELFTFHMLVGWLAVVFFFVFRSCFNWIQLLHLSKFLFILWIPFFLLLNFFFLKFWTTKTHFNFVMYGNLFLAMESICFFTSFVLSFSREGEETNEMA